MCTGDLGAMTARKFTCSVMPERNDYGDIISTSNRTLSGTKLNESAKKMENEYLHMLNGTAIVMTRIPLVNSKTSSRKMDQLLSLKFLEVDGKEKEAI
jgi:seryl-tRNA synthetase